ncbi:MAG: histone family protein [Candidatus Aenigmarchaeota archaeon]|nr:histone family protein [Candidatus Aenigmarchaeota archaeon]
MSLPLAPFERIVKKAGAKRVSANAVEELRDIIEEYGLEIAKKAWNIAQHSGRRTVQKKDIKFVVQ